MDNVPTVTPDWGVRLEKMELLNTKIMGHEYRIYGDDITINLEDDGDDTVKIKNLHITLDGKECDDFGENFVGYRFSSDEAAQSIIRAFINGDMEYAHDFSGIKPHKELMKGWHDVFEPTDFHLSFDDGRVRTISKKYLGSYGVLKLQMVNKEYISYYSNGDECVVIRKDGSIATDMECFYENSFMEDVENGNYLYLAKGMVPENI